ncbi:hypothetical protein HYFRA_00007314, partial [Hymenoscyphus fraxineus]
LATMADRAAPTPVAMLIGTAIVAGLTGYMIGIASSLGFFPIPFQNAPPKKRGVEHYDDEEESEEEDIEESLLDHAPNWANGVEADRRDGLKVQREESGKGKKEGDGKGGVKVKREDGEGDGKGWTSKEEYKMVLVVRTDLGMTKGKIAAQCGHATLACYKTNLRKNPQALKVWETGGQAKIAVQVKSEEELLTLQAMAQSLGITAEVIHDAGRTQIASGSATVLGVGPAPRGLVDGVTGGLKLL